MVDAVQVDGLSACSLYYSLKLLELGSHALEVSVPRRQWDIWGQRLPGAFSAAGLIVPDSSMTLWGMCGSEKEA